MTYSPDDVLVADQDGRAVGYTAPGRPTPVEADRHVLQIQGRPSTPAAGGRAPAAG